MTAVVCVRRQTGRAMRLIDVTEGHRKLEGGSPHLTAQTFTFPSKTP